MSKIVDAVLAARYLREGESSFEDVCRRVSTAITDDVDMQKQYFEAMVNLDFLPNSPTLMNAGTPMGQLSACFTLPVEDSLKDIFDAVQWGALIHQSGGGTGYNFSKIRAEGSPVHSTDGVASGPVSFMRVFNSATDVIKQGGRRRGANMGILNADHPDILKFLKSKEVEGEISNFNISVMVNDDFMSEVYDGYMSPKNAEIWEAIVDGVWKNGEPGILFYDTINDNNPTPWLGNIEITNPCVTGDTLILTDEGYVPIIDTLYKKVNVWNGVEWSEVEPYFVASNQTIYDVSFSNGTAVRATGDHRWFTTDGVKTTLELTTSDELIKTKMPVVEGTKVLEDAYRYGFFCGDGYYNYHKDMNIICIYEPKRCCFPEEDFEHITSRCKNLSVPHEWSKTFVPDASYTVESRKQWLAGLIDSDGVNQGGYHISSIDKDFLVRVGYMVNTLGCNFKVKLMQPETVKPMPDGKGGSALYYCHDCYRLILTKNDSASLDLPLKRVKKAEYGNRDAGRFVKVVSVVESGCEDVFCCTEPNRHQITLNGNPSSNCGEQPLLPFESCVLGSINVSNLVNEDGVFNSKRYFDLINLGVRFLNDVLDHNSFPIPQIKNATLNTRKIGLGIMGLHDALIKMNVPYSSSYALAFCTELATTLEHVSHRMSEELADTYGTYPAYDSTHADASPRMRNAATTTIAPTGSISILAGCSSGIEPNFSYVYERRNTVGESFKIIHPLFESALEDLKLDKDLKEIVIDEMFTKGSIAHLSWLPEEFRARFETALDIDGYRHIDVQVRFQKHIDASISKTINVPEDTSKEEIKGLIKYAWEKGCKGLTIYRNNSRKDVVLSLKDKTPEEHKCDCKCNHHFDRPKTLEGTTHKVKSGCCDLYVTVNTDAGRPVEVFIQTAGTGCNASNVALGRMISVALQNNIDVKDVVKQLSKVNCISAIKNKNSEGKSCADVVGKCLMDNFANNTTSNPVINACPECGAELDFGEGCNMGICKHCGWSGCS